MPVYRFTRHEVLQQLEEQMIGEHVHLDAVVAALLEVAVTKDDLTWSREVVMPEEPPESFYQRILALDT